MTTHYRTRIEPESPATIYDDALRWTIPSRTNPHETYLVELNNAPGYDVCQCMHFVGKLQPLLARGVSPEEAVASGVVKIKKHERISDALKCWHIREAEYRYMLACKSRMCAMRKESRT